MVSTSKTIAPLGEHRKENRKDVIYRKVMCIQMIGYDMCNLHNQTKLGIYNLYIWSRTCANDGYFSHNVILVVIEAPHKKKKSNSSKAMTIFTTYNWKVDPAGDWITHPINMTVNWHHPLSKVGKLNSLPHSPIFLGKLDTHWVTQLRYLQMWEMLNQQKCRFYIMPQMRGSPTKNQGFPNQT